MDKHELLAEFRAQLDLFEKYQTFIDKARSYQERFNPAVVEKVIKDNTEKIEGVAAILNPHVPDMRAHIASLEADGAAVHEGVESARLELEEMELRLAIGEVEESEFEAASAALRERLETVDAQTSAIQGELDEIAGLLNRWLAVRPHVEEPAEETAYEEEAPAEDDVLGELEQDDGVELGAAEEPAVEEDLLAGSDDGFEDEGGRGEGGVHAEKVAVEDDVSMVFAPEASASASAPSIGERSESLSFSPEDLGGLGEDDAGDRGASGGVGAARAILILGENSPDEHIFPFTGEVMTLGRGRDNTIQVKNDSKVSRYHCKIFMRDNNFFMQDNQSANGTLVDGELITEKRLLGGEELIVGETFFRFKILR